MYTRESLASYQVARVEVGQLRLLALATLASLVLHALLLYALPIVKEAVRAPARPLTARLAKPEPPKAEPLPQPKPAVQAALPRPASAVQRTAPAPAPAPAPVAPIPSVEPAQRAAEPAPQTSAARADLAPAPASALVPASSGPDPGSVARFRLELMEIARRYKRYPRIAQDNGWEGRVELRIAFAESGSISSLTVNKGAGRAVLDEAAQAMIRSAQAQAAIPPALRGKAFVLEIPVDFLLKDEAR